MKRKILMIYTGGTIGMKQDEKSMALVPVDISQIQEEVPELKKFGYSIDTYSFDPVIDSSDITPEFWVNLCNLIKKNYEKYDGFVILHGTDTMSYTASALSFMMENLAKPVVLTGSQLPVGMLRTDGKENIISSIEIAAAVDETGHAMVPEVCIYFESQLYRGNRTTKYNAENFRAFRSANYPVLADVGIHIKFNRSLIQYPKRWDLPLKLRTKLDTNVAILKIFPGITPQAIDAVMGTKGCRAVVLETFGSGNAPTTKQFVSTIKKWVKKGLIVVNVTQCQAGKVDMGAYATGVALREAGVVSGYDSTTEATLCKLFVLLGRYSSSAMVKKELQECLCGEISIK
ncbi:MAG: type I asparaginase [Bacteroidales bacterium]|nr:type I asparaginase [Bacteroidales bacterium]MBR5908020.1 type I asparaginase [Bacteroidales bacterium]